MLHEFDEDTQEAIRKALPEDLLAQADSGAYTPTQGAGGRHWAPEADAVGQPGRASATATLPRQGGDG
jgi:phospholipid/cholesterol/gamma-HCH transport system ATP-binding protein